MGLFKKSTKKEEAIKKTPANGTEHKNKNRLHNKHMLIITQNPVRDLSRDRALQKSIQTKLWAYAVKKVRRRIGASYTYNRTINIIAKDCHVILFQNRF